MAGDQECIIETNFKYEAHVCFCQILLEGRETIWKHPSIETYILRNLKFAQKSTGQKKRRYHQIAQQNIESMNITDWTNIFWTMPGVFSKNSPNSAIN